MNPLREARRLFWLGSTVGFARGPHITRYAMYARLRAIGPTLPKREGRVLSIGDSTNLVDLLDLRATEVVEANYPEHNILSLRFENDAFDFVLSDQVLEHVEGSPQQAIDECHRVLRPGGIAVHTTCFINPVHGSPGDFWRFTPDALALLHRGWSERLEASGWGNFEAWKFIRTGLRVAGIPHAKWHPLHRLATRNDPLWPIVTWVIARK